MILGFVTKTGASPLSFNQTPGNVGATGGAAYSARKLDGTNMGSYKSAGEAMRAFESRIGAGVGSAQNIQWTRSDLSGDIEHWVCQGEPWTPLEIWGSNLRLWIEPDYSGGSVILANAATLRLFRAQDLSTKDVYFEQTTVADQPVISEGGNYFNGRRRITYAAVGTEYLTAAGVNWTDLSSTPFTLFQVANYDEPAGTARDILDIGGLTLGVNAAGNWEYTNGGGAITGPAAGTDAAILTVEQEAFSTNFRVDGTSVGVNLGPAVAVGAVTMGGTGARIWEGGIAAIIMTDVVDTNDVRVLKTERWLRNRFQG